MRFDRLGVIYSLQARPGVTISVPFAVRTPQPSPREWAEVRSHQIVYLRTLEGRNTVATASEGFSQSPQDHQIRIEKSRLGMGLSWRTARCGTFWPPSLTPSLQRSLLTLLKESSAAYGWCRTRWRCATLALQLQAQQGLRLSRTCL